jgi:ornithine cyclodeaminase/alanine dehydrogenase-like protein (mu-crystallin family)
MILMALRTGMRQGELKGLKWRSIDLVNRSVRGADVIVTPTNALEPFLKGVWLKPTAHVNAALPVQHGENWTTRP